MSPLASDTTLIVWPCYEPAGYAVSLTAEALAHHVMIVGSTGSGKTTLLLGAIEQLLRHPMGLLILDAKQDGVTEQIVEMAARSGRKDDLVILGPAGTHVLDLFGALRSFDDVDTLTQRLLLGTDLPGGDNPYWAHATSAMVSAALTLLAAQRKPVAFAEAVEFMRGWFASLQHGPALPDPVARIVERAKSKGTKPGASPQLQGALDYVQVWQQLDPRTRSNLQSCLLQVLRPLLSEAATRSFAARDRSAFDPARVAAEGKLCVVGANALTQPDLCRFLLRLARKQFFDAVQSRGAGPHPFCGVVADEFPLIVEREDANQLATLRSKSCFVLAATQGLSGLDEKIGWRLRRAVLLNFNTVILLRTREEETGEFAVLSLGTRDEPPPARKTPNWEDGVVAALFPILPPVPFPRLVCPPGTLGRLQPHQGFVVGADGTRTSRPVWFAPWFECHGKASPARTAPPEDHAAFTAQYLCELMQRCAFSAVLSPAIVGAAAQLESDLYPLALRRAHEYFLEHTGAVPEGLETLPAGWLAGLPRILWQSRKRDCMTGPCAIRRVAYKEGVLLIGFAREPRPHGQHRTAWDRIRIRINCCLYPNRWRPLLRRHRQEVMAKWPHLRQEFQATGQDFA